MNKNTIVKKWYDYITKTGNEITLDEFIEMIEE